MSTSGPMARAAAPGASHEPSAPPWHPFDPKRPSPPTVPAGSVLILFDLSETLILRTERAVTGAPQGPELRWNGKTVYLRPRVREMLATLQAHPRCALGFYTSIKAENARPVIEALCSPSDPATRVFALFDRDYSIRDPNGDKKWDTMRSLPRVWAAPVCQGLFNEHNTILIDNTPRKVRNHMSNALIVPPWEKEQLVAGDDRVMPALAAYFTAMLDAGANGDVRAYMRATPFEHDLSRPPRRGSSSRTPAAGPSAPSKAPAQPVPLAPGRQPVPRTSSFPPMAAAAAAAAAGRRPSNPAAPGPHPRWPTDPGADPAAELSMAGLSLGKSASRPGTQERR